MESKVELIKYITRKKSTESDEARLAAIKLVMDMDNDKEVEDLLAYHRSNLYTDVQRKCYDTMKNTVYECECGCVLKNSLSKYSHVKNNKKHLAFIQNQKAQNSQE